MNGVHYSSASHEWETPQALFDALDAEFGFTLDAAASHGNAKCERYLTAGIDALGADWTGSVFCNPPYGYGIGKWVKKGFDAAQRGATVVLLIPSRTDTAWWHDYAMQAEEIRLIRGRLYFKAEGSIAAINAPFPSCVVVFRPGVHSPRFVSVPRILDPGTTHAHKRAPKEVAR